VFVYTYMHHYNSYRNALKTPGSVVAGDWGESDLAMLDPNLLEVLSHTTHCRYSFIRSYSLLTLIAIMILMIIMLVIINDNTTVVRIDRNTEF
jgi:hypothetical protein